MIPRFTSSLRIRASSLALAAGLLALAPSGMALAQSMLQGPYDVSRSETWTEQELRRFKTYPRLDMAYRLIAEGKKAEAVKELEAFLQADPADDNVRVMLVNLLLDLGRNQEAETRASELLAKRPGQPRTLFIRAVARERQGKIQEALEDYEAVASSPDVKDQQDRRRALTATANLSYSLGRHHATLKALDELETIKPGDPEVQRLRGHTLLALGRPNEAAEAFGKTGGQAEAAEAWRQTGQRALAVGDQAGATAAFGKAIAAAEAKGDRELLAGLHSQAGRTQDAAREYKTLIERAASDSERGRLWMALGETLAAAGDAANAAQAFAQAERYAPAESGGAAALAQARALAAKGDAAGAAESIRRAMRAKPGAGLQNDPWAVRALAEDALSRGRNEEAVQAFESLLAMPEGPHSRRSEVLAGLTLAKRRMGDREGATRTLRMALAEPKISPAERARLNRELLDDVMAAGNSKEIEAQIDAVLADPAARLNDSDRARMLLVRADIRRRDGRTAKAREDYAQALRLGGGKGELSGRERFEAHMAAGHLAFAAGDMKTALGNFQKAAALQRSPAAEIGAGQALFRLGRKAEAAQAFDRALAAGESPVARAGLTRALLDVGKPGVAAEVSRPLVPPPPQLLKDETALRSEEHAYALLASGNFAESAAVYERVLKSRDSTDNRVRLARARRLSGDPHGALAALEVVSGAPDSKEPLGPKALGVEGLMESGKAKAELGRHAEARAEYHAAIDLIHGPEGTAASLTPEQTALAAEAWFESGESSRAEAAAIQRREGQKTGEAAKGQARVLYEEAAASYSQAARLAPGPRHDAALGYALLAAGRTDEAADALQRTVAAEPDYLRVYEDLGYANMKLVRNPEAAAWFRQSIDNAETHAVRSPEERRKREEDILRMRGEVAKLENRFDLDAWWGYVTGETGDSRPEGALPGSATSGISRSGAGVEAAWIPPIIGFRDDRIFRVIGRLTWATDTDSMELDSDRLQAAVGLRYKPFKSQNINFGFERLFGIGDEAEDNWLARVLGSWTDGNEPKPLDRDGWWNYTFLFGEAYHYLDSPSRSGAYAEVRQGVAFALTESAFIAPHVLADVSWKSNTHAGDVSFWEVGAGFSLRHFFNETYYESWRSNQELLVQYKLGHIFDAPDADTRDTHALFITYMVHF